MVLLIFVLLPFGGLFPAFPAPLAVVLCPPPFPHLLSDAVPSALSFLLLCQVSLCFQQH